MTLLAKFIFLLFFYISLHQYIYYVLFKISHIMKKQNIITILLMALFFICLPGKGQVLPVDELNTDMQRYYKGCMILREGIQQKNAIILDKAIELLDEDPQNPNRIELYDLQIECVDTMNQCSMKDHMYYNADYAEFYKENMGMGVFTEPAESLRNIPKNCHIAHRAIKARSKTRYRTKMMGICQIFVLAELGGTINVSVLIPNEGEYEGQSYENGTVSYAKWNMHSFPAKQVELIIENTSDKDISFVIATN